MKIAHSDFKKGEVKLKVENLDDLWHLSQLIEEGDIVQGKTERKIKVGSKDERNQDSVKKTIFLAISVEKVEFSPHANILRVSGTATAGPEDVPLGSYHTFSVEEQSIMTLIKPQWLRYHKEKLDEASKEKNAKILICVHDREEAFFALMKRYGYELLSHIQGEVQKKREETKAFGSFYKEIISQLQNYDKKYELSCIIVASPAFWKEELLKELSDDALRKKIILATSSSVGENAIHEVLKRPETEAALKHERVSREFKLVDDLLIEIAKNGNSAYGLKETKEAAEMGAIKMLLITDLFIQEKRQAKTYLQIDEIMKKVDQSNGDICIISMEHEAGRKLQGLGGIAAMVRYKIK